MRTLLSRILILLAVIGLIFAPPVLTGYAELQNAEAAWANGDFSSSAKLYARTLRFLPWRTDLWEKAATSSFFIGEFEKSIFLFENAVRYDSLSAGGWDLYGQAFWWRDNHETAQKIWLTGLDAYPSYTRLF